MQFTSLQYAVFFCAVFALHWALPQKWRPLLCLAASVGFYALFGAPMLAVLALCILGSYLLALWLETQKSRAALLLCLTLALVPLATFKYFDALAQLFGARTALSAMTPVGLSFFTFKIIAYLVEVWRGKLAAQHSFGKYALYVSFFPEIASGPIQRPGDLMSQLAAQHAFSKAQAMQGAQLVLWGLFKKLAIADNLASYVQVGFTKPDLVTGGSVILACILYSIQLYCDFSGYSDIAIGCMQLLGYEVPANFRSPYFAVSVRDFWARWHISLSGFLRDYVYFPLGGSKKGTARTCGNLLLTFFISGLWHGTGPQFLVWGALHGVYQVFGRLTRPLRSGLWRAAHLCEEGVFARTVKTVITFLLVTAAWVFFGAQSLPAALHLFARMPDSFAFSLQYVKNALSMLGLTAPVLLRLGPPFLLLCAVDFASRHAGFSAWLTARKGWVQLALCYAFLLAVVFLAPASGGGFIYFQF